VVQGPGEKEKGEGTIGQADKEKKQSFINVPLGEGGGGEAVAHESMTMGRVSPLCLVCGLES
jgi:hypothetical protein